MKKAWKCCSALMLALVLALASGCNPNYRPEFEYGDFICREWGTERRAIAIKDLSEQGETKKSVDHSGGSKRNECRRCYRPLEMGWNQLGK